MIRLLAPLLLALLGGLTGLAIKALLAPRAPGTPAAIAGAFGSFGGLWLHDLLDLGGAMAGGLSAAVIGAIALSLPVAWFGPRR